MTTMSLSTPSRRVQIQTLAGCVLVALAAGTNYVYSAYAPQLGQKLNLNHTQLNVIGIAGNIGVYFFAPVSGYVVDRRGPKLPLFTASILLFLGYGGIAFLFSRATPQPSSTGWILSPLVSVLALCSFATGVAGSAGVISAMNAGVKVVEDKYHASTTGGINSAFGLSAFFFSTIARELFPGRIGAFLVVLCVGTGGAVFLGGLLVRSRPVDGQVQLTGADEGAAEEEEDHGPERPVWGEDTPLRYSTDDSVLYGERNPWASQAATPVASGAGTPRSSTLDRQKEEDVHGLGLTKSLDFWVIFGVVGCLGGPGLMYINNVGSIVQALFSSGNDDWDKTAAVAAQASQVGLLSVCSFVGRLGVGFLADHLSHTHTIPRTSCLTLSSIIGIAASSILFNVTKPEHLWAVSSTLGVAYGSTFALFPALVLERFGLGHFSQNVGLMGIAAALFGNVYNYAFGRNFDSHSKPSILSGEGMVCLEGRGCYIQSVYVALVSCVMALILSGVATWRSRTRRGIALE